VDCGETAVCPQYPHVLSSRIRGGQVPPRCNHIGARFKPAPTAALSCAGVSNTVLSRWRITGMVQAGPSASRRPASIKHRRVDKRSAVHQRRRGIRWTALSLVHPTAGTLIEAA